MTTALSPFGLRKATTTEAQAGTESTAYMTPETTKAAVDQFATPAAHVDSTDGHPVATDTDDGFMSSTDKAYFDSQATVQAITADGATTAIDLDDGRVAVVTLEVATTAISFTNARAGFDECLVRYVQDVVGGRTITHPAGTLLANGINLSLSAAAAAKDDWYYYTLDGGTTWNASLTGADMAVPA
jgi:hypothetical protein